MKIIEKSERKIWTKQLRCTGFGNGEMGCGSLLEVEHTDLFRTTSHHYDGSSEDYVTWECPICGEWTDLSAHIHPPPVQSLPHRSAPSPGEKARASGKPYKLEPEPNNYAVRD